MADIGTETAATLPAEGGRTSVWLKLVYGLGSMAFGIKDNGFQTILLIFYNQVVGMNALAVGGAILIALAVDAIMDPIIGEVSDNLRTRWGRRHPLMYASAVPLGLSYLFLWNPPHLSQGWLFVYLVGVSVIVRTFISLYEAPSQALTAELTTDYAERTSLLGYRSFFQWFGGLLMYALAFQVFLRPDRAHPVGQLNPVGYAHYGLAAGLLMMVTILLSAFGTHGRIKHFVQPGAARPRSMGEILADVGQTLANGSYLSLLVSILFSATATGLAFSMNLYFYTYVWALSTGQIALFALSNMVSAFAASVLARWASARDKRRSTVLLFVTGLAIANVPLALRMLGLFLPNADPLLFPALLIFALVGLSMMIAGGILAASMVADVVEDSQLKTGRRSEGLFFAGATFVQKATSGLGVFLSSLILALVQFPAKAAPGAAQGAKVDPAVIAHLVLVYLPMVVGLYLVSLICLAGYRITRQTHEASLKQLAEEAAKGVAVIPEI
jgi:GPH family glycoside/pentoside/hexuronide:cation symporter